MAEPLKNAFGPEIAARIADAIAAVHTAFDRRRFLDAALDGYDALELTPRARQIAAALAGHLTADRKAAIEILVDSLDGTTTGAPDGGMGSFVFMPHGYFVAEHGLECFETSMRALNEITRRFTSEFAIRPFLERHPERTLRRLRRWAADPDVHVRRLVSEGTRPRLPWAPRLERFRADPTPVLELLERLKDDPEEYVRRSVANNLNDIAKDHPDRVVETARRWWADAGPERQRLLRHGLRTLIKQGHPEALAILGYGANSPARVAGVSLPDRVAIGDRLRVEVMIANPADTPAAALVDLRVHFVKASGATSPKVFKGAEVELAPGAETTVRKSISLAQHSTRTHYPGTHRLEVLLNGQAVPGGRFELAPEADVEGEGAASE